MLVGARVPAHRCSTRGWLDLAQAVRDARAQHGGMQALFDPAGAAVAVAAGRRLGAEACWRFSGGD